MSIKHVIHIIGIPGLPGDGFSAPDAATLRADVDALQIDMGNLYTQSQVDALIALNRPITFSAKADGTTMSATTVGAFTYFNAVPATISVPAGTYRATGMAVIPVTRSAGGDMYTRVRIGGAGSDSHYLHTSHNFGGVSPSPLIPVVAIDLTITTSGTVALEFGIGNSSTAGTVSSLNAAMTFTLTKVG